MTISGRNKQKWLSISGLTSLFILLPALAHAGIQVKHPHFSLVADGFLNATTARGDGTGATGIGIEADLRVLVLHKNASGFEWGARYSYSATSFDNGRETQRAHGVEDVSLLVQGDWGRLEIGRRQGLPDVLTGVAPNNYTFTSTEYGPATGRNINPAARLPTSFMDADLGARVNALSTLGFVSAFTADRSEKIILALPRSESGLVAGISYAPDISDGRRNPGFGSLWQTGLTYDHYWRSNQLHLGGSYAYVRGENTRTGLERESLSSLNLGAAVTLKSALAIGFSVTYNGDSGQFRGSQQERSFGWVTSINYNKGPWTYGGFYQHARGQGDPFVAGNERLEAMQLGLSYRFNIRSRLYTALYRAELEGDRGATEENIWLLGLRLII